MTSAFERCGLRLARRILVLLCLGTAPALAANEGSDVEARTAARALAAQGAQAFERHEYERALDLFERASEIVSAPTIKLMQARTLVELGRLVDALAQYEETQQLLAVDATNEAFRQAGEAARQEQQMLLQRMPTLRVRVAGAAIGEPVEVLVDGKKLSAEQAGVDRPIDPGEHHIEARAASGRSGSRDVTIPEGDHMDVELALTTPAPVAATTPVQAPPTASNRGSTQTLGWVLGATGAAFTVTGTVTGIMALKDKATLDAVCTPGCPAAHADTIEAWRRERTVSYVSFGLGAVGLAAGAYFVLSDRNHVGVSVGPQRVALVGSFR